MKSYSKNLYFAFGTFTGALALKAKKFFIKFSKTRKNAIECYTVDNTGKKVLKFTKKLKPDPSKGKTSTYHVTKSRSKIKKGKNGQQNKKINKGGSKTSLLNELANSSVKHNPDDVITVVKNPDGNLMWLEKSNSKAGLTHILERHADDFASQGVNDIPKLLENVLTTTPIKIGG